MRGWNLRLKNKKRLPIQSLKLKIALDTIILFLLLAVINVFMSLNATFTIILNVILYLTYFILIFWYERKRYDNIYYYITKDYLVIEKGIIFKVKLITSLNYVKGFKYSQGLIQKFLDLYTISFYTEGKNIFLVNVGKSDVLLIKENLGDKIEI